MAEFYLGIWRVFVWEVGKNSKDYKQPLISRATSVGLKGAERSPDGTDGAVTLRYYSAHYKNLFEAKDAFVFRNDDHLGTVAAPYAPAFVVVK